jgi:hypothetical protein
MGIWCKEFVNPSLRHSLQSVLNLMELDPISHMKRLPSYQFHLESFPTLQADYTKTWSALFHDIVTHFLGTVVTVATCNDTEEAVIFGMGCPLGMLVLASDGAGFTCRTPRFAGIGPLEISWTLSFPLSTYDDKIQDGYILCLLEGADSPSLIRRSGDYFTVVKVAFTPQPRFILKGFKTYGASERLDWETFRRYIPNFRRQFVLVWDWPASLLDLESRHRAALQDAAQAGCDLDAASRALNMVRILEDIGDFPSLARLLNKSQAIGTLWPSEHFTTLRYVCEHWKLTCAHLFVADIGP